MTPYMEYLNLSCHTDLPLDQVLLLLGERPVKV